MKRLTILLAAAAILAGACNGDSSTGVSGTTPTVTSTGPASAATSVATNVVVTATFSEPMQVSSVNAITFTLRQGTTRIPGTVICGGTNATFTPTVALDSNVTYTAEITNSVTSLAGIRMAAQKSWTFTTAIGQPAPSPTVLSTTPAGAASGVARNASVTATFSAPMASATINGTTFTLKNGVTAVPATVTYTGTTATLVPNGLLAANAVFTAAISTGATNLTGQPLTATASWSFNTDTALSTQAPTVISTAPASAAIGVARNASITAIFSAPMASATIDSATFTLKNGVNAVPATVTYAGTTATLNPSSTLAGNTTYTAAISTGVTNTTGQHLAAIKSWSFTTVASNPSGPAAVNLGTAGNYVILAKTGVSTTGAGAVVGDIGLSPAAATFITGFSLTLDGTSTFATSAMVTGKVWAADYTPPTPSNLTTAVLDMQTAYTDAAGRVLPDFTELGAGNIQGLTLVPGLYKWGTGVDLPSAVTLSGGANDVWIFQIAQDLTVGNGAIVTLTGGAQAKNVFWQVAGQATLGTTSQFKGIILSQTLISFNTGASITGRALAQTAVTLNATTVTHP